MVFTRKLFPFFFPPSPPPPFPSSDSSVVDVRGSSKPRRICKLFFLSLLNRFDKGGEKREKRGEATDVVERKGWKEGRNEANKYNRRGIRTKRGARSPMKEIYDCLLIKKGRGGDRIVSSRSRKD